MNLAAGTPLALVADVVVPAVIAFFVCAAAWAASRGRLHRADRIGAAALAVGFAVLCGLVTGTGWRPERVVTWLPLVAVVGALLGPRIASRAFPEAQVPLLARGFVLVAAAGAAAAMFAAGRGEAGALELGVLGAALGSGAGERLGDETGESGLARPDRRPGTWVLAALLVGLVPVLAA